MVNKSDHLESIILGYQPHIVVITETWLHEGIDDEDVFPPLYRVFRRDRSTRGGGVAVLVKHGIDTSFLTQIERHESLALKLSCFGRSFLVIAVYRAPNSPPQFLRELSDFMNDFHHDRILLIGDLNLPSINWDKPFLNPDHAAHEEHIFNIMLRHDLQQVVRQPTRVHGCTSSLLDLIFVSRSISDYHVSIEQGISDHDLVYCSFPVHIVCKKPVAKVCYVKDFSRAKDESVLDYLDFCLSSFRGSNADELWNKFKTLCTHCLENFVPNKIIKSRKASPWITREVLQLKRKVKRLKRGGASRFIIQSFQISLNAAVRSAKRHYFEYRLPNFIRTSPEKFWNHLCQKKKPIDRIMHDGKPLTDKNDIATQFNRYFHSVFANASGEHYSFETPSTMPSITISRPGIVELLLNLKTKASPGPDKIPNAFLRRYAEKLSEFLVVIFCASLSSAVIPSEWKTARVVPVLKKGDASLISNYRPISLTSTCCKLLEHIIAKYIIGFLDDNNILSNVQHGFRKGFSTVTQLTSVVHSFASVLDKSGQADIIFMDFSKAFDLVSHSKLIDKLKQVGLPNFIVNWVSAYLSNRQQFVSIDDHYSNSLPVSSGVPQGSVLGPLLFLIYVNDIVKVVTHPVQIRLFADDCVLFNVITCREDQLLLNLNLKNILDWCNQWDMKLNAQKTVFMRLTKKKNSLLYPYALPSFPLSEVTEYKYLGVTITNNLSWNKHIGNVCASGFRKLCVLKHKLKHAPADLKFLAYSSLIRPKLEYACIVWDPFTKTNIQALEMIQRKAIRFIFSKYRSTDSPTAIMRAHRIQTLQVRRKILRLKFLFLLKHNKLSMCPDPYVKPFSAPRPTRHRHSDSLTPFTARTNLFKYSFFPRTVTEWNALPLTALCDIDSIEKIED